MKVGNAVQAPRQPVQHRPPARQPEQVQPKQPEPKKPEGPVGRNLDLKA